MRIFVLPLILLVSGLYAMDAAFSLGGLVTSGNSDVKQLDTGLELTGSPSPSIETGFSFRASYGSQEGETYLETYLAEAKPDYSFTEKDYAASRIYWTKDEFSGVSSEYGSTIGYGRRLFTDGDFIASLEAGAGYLSRENTLGGELSTSTWYGGTNIAWDLSDSWQITEVARVTGDLQDSENYSVESESAASSSITGNLSFVLGYNITYHSLPPVEGNENTDTALKVQLRLDI